MKIYQHATLSADPVEDMDAATKRYVDVRVNTAGVGLFVTNVNAVNGNESPVYVANTVPPNKVVSQATIDNFNPVRISIVAEGGAAFYSPVVRVDVDPLNPSTTGVVATLAETASDFRFFTGTADIDATTYLPTPGDTKTIYVWSNTGAVTSVVLVRAEAPPEVRTATIGAYPLGPTGVLQTAVKGTDSLLVTGTVDNNASLVEIISNTGAAEAGTYTTSTVGGLLGANDSGGAGRKSFTVQFTVDNGRTGAQSITLRARNTIGTYGSNFTTSNTVVLDQTYPSFSLSVTGYPGGRTALKSGESATLNTASMAGWTNGTDVITYTSTTTGLTFTDTSTQTSTTFGATKTINYTGTGYVDSGTNLSALATRLNNGAQTNQTTLAKIAAVAPTAAFAIAGNPARLISSVAGQNYTVNVTTSQELPSAPSITATSGNVGTVTGSNKSWSFTLTIDDADPKGAQSFSINMTNRAGIAGTTITSGGTYTVGGFTNRDVTVGALEQVVDLGVLITDPTKVTVKYTGTSDNLTYRATDLTQFQKGWSKVDGAQLIFTAGAEPFQNYSGFTFTTSDTSWLFLTDADFCGANTTGTLQVNIQEVA
jgi:hypothetical protein